MKEVWVGVFLDVQRSKNKICIEEYILNLGFKNFLQIILKGNEFIMEKKKIIEFMRKLVIMSELVEVIKIELEIDILCILEFLGIKYKIGMFNIFKGIK